MLFVVLCPGTPEGSTGSGSGFKASQKTGQQHANNLVSLIFGKTCRHQMEAFCNNKLFFITSTQLQMFSCRF